MGAAAISGGVGAAATLVGGLIGSGKAKRAEQRAEKKLATLEANRQEIKDPYSDYENVSGLASNAYEDISNPYANIGVSTQAAEFQASQVDQSLATTLDNLRATGSGAGGATALAQAAAQSKLGISAEIGRAHV